MELGLPPVLSHITHTGADRPLMRIGGTVMCACRAAERRPCRAGSIASPAIRGSGEAVSHDLAGQFTVALHDLTIALPQVVRAPIVGGDHPDQMAGPVDERSRLHRTETRSRRDGPVGCEARIGRDIDDDGLSLASCRPSARRAVVVNHREVIEELGPEPVLGDDHQRTSCWVQELDVAAIGSTQRQRPLENLAEQQAGAG